MMDYRYMDSLTKDQVNRFFSKLELYYPEHKVFALDSIDKDLRERLTALHKKAGYATADAFLNAHGYETISGEAVQKLRGPKKTAPGKEPAVIKQKVASALARLDEYYPDRVIKGSIQNDHKSLSQSISGLYQWLGYSSVKDMLEAYGYTVIYKETGRPATNDYDGIVRQLQELYRGQKAKSVGQIDQEHPELAGPLKTLKNRAKELFGTSFKDYMVQVGVIEARESPQKDAKTETAHFIIVKIEGTDQPVPCSTKTRALHEGDFVEIQSPADQSLMIGDIRETHYYTPLEELPCPLDEMHSFVRKVSKTEIKDAEASKLKYLYCSIRLKGAYDTLYYISPFETVEVGDIVRVPHVWYGEVNGQVEKTEWASDKTAPYPPKRTKQIIRIVKSQKAEKEKSKQQLEQLVREAQTKPFVPIQIDKSLSAQLDQMTCFTGAVFRGFDYDIEAALREAYPTEWDLSSRKIEILKGFSQFACENAQVMRILPAHPSLKAIFFAEDWKHGYVYLAFSETGCTSVNELRLIGKCNFYKRDRWTLIHDPAEDGFLADGIQYLFEEKTQWEAVDYVLPDGKTQLCSDEVAPSVPFRKKKMDDPIEKITIQYPEHEIFSESAPKRETPKTTPAVSGESDGLAGQIFVVTGDLFCYPSRNALKDIIVQGGGKMTGSVSQKTTALITNFPDSGTTKIREAKALGIPIISEQEFIDRYLKTSAEPDTKETTSKNAPEQDAEVAAEMIVDTSTQKGEKTMPLEMDNLSLEGVHFDKENVILAVAYNINPEKVNLRFGSIIEKYKIESRRSDSNCIMLAILADIADDIPTFYDMLLILDHYTKDWFEGDWLDSKRFIGAELEDSEYFVFEMADRECEKVYGTNMNDYLEPFTDFYQFFQPAVQEMKAEQDASAEAEREAREAAEKAEAERKAREAAEKAEAERKAREAAEKAEAERKAAEKAKKQQEEKRAYEEAMLVWDQETKRVKAVREDELARRRSDKERELTEQCNRTYLAAKTAAEQALSEAQQKKTKAEKALSSLGVFRFSEKKRQSILIDEATEEIAKAERAISDSEASKAAFLAEMEGLLSQYMSGQEKDIEQAFPLPAEPVRPDHMK